ncbi:MAG: hypothetical protein ABR574_08480 [Cryomorphaceae bacterium]|nr:hypothetical protein [Flavobacteriales bacterium]
MLKVVSNTTPLISLLRISRLDILESLYKKILIPRAVYDEVEAGKNKDYYSDLLEFPWIDVVEIEDKQAIKC